MKSWLLVRFFEMFKDLSRYIVLEMNVVITLY